jgi:hypothetical protein
VKLRDLVTPLALVLVAAGTAAYAYLVDREKVSDADRAARRTDVFPSFRVEEVSRLEITHGDESLVLERDAGAGDGGAAGWRMKSPRSERADPSAVDMLLRELELATRLREVTTDDVAGLDAPRARGKVQVGALEYRFALGADAPRPEGAAYLHLEGEGTFVVGRSLKVQLLRGADAYRERALVPYGASGVARLEVRAASGASFALERAGATFRLPEEGVRASRAAVDALLTALGDARAETFLDDGTADRATERPAFTVRVVPRDGAHEGVELRVGGECPGQPGDVVVVRTAPSRVSACTAHSLVDALAVPASALVDASPFFAHADEMEELRLERVEGGQTGQGPLRVEAVRRGTGWRERSPEDRDLTADETDSANLLALALAEARGSDVHRAPAGDVHFQVRARVTVVRTGGQSHEVVEVGAPSTDGTTPVRRVDDGATLRVARSVARRFEPHPVAFHGRSVWPAPLETGAVVAIDDTCTPAPERLELHERTWTLRGPAGLAADGVSVADQVGTLSRLKSDGWIAETDDGSFGFEGPGACTVTLTLEAGDASARRVTLRLGANGDGGVYARAQDDGAVFVASPGVRQVLAHPAIDRSRFHVEPGPGWSVTVVHAGARRLVSPDAASDDRLAAAVAGVFAQSALHAGPPLPGEGLDHPTLELVAAGRNDAGAPVETHILVGAETRVDEGDAYFARVSGVDATFAVPKVRVTAILDAL